MNETIIFPEDKILEVIAIIRLGIQYSTSNLIKQDTKEQLEIQCKKLESYYFRGLTNG